MKLIWPAFHHPQGERAVTLAIAIQPALLAFHKLRALVAVLLAIMAVSCGNGCFIRIEVTCHLSKKYVHSGIYKTSRW